MPGEPYWYKDAILYEVHVRAFADSTGSGVGDFAGLTSKLDYLHDLGVTALWLLPFYPSPLKDDGYDIADYTSVHPMYGSLKDFETFLHEAHKRGLRVITELVVNHTSDQHPWFQRARRAPAGSPLRDFYVWSDTPEKYRDARIIFKDFEHSNWAWDPVAKAYYWHRFYSHQPDLNFDNPQVHDAVLAVLDFWLDLGVDGMRLDAVPYLYEREGTNCENLAETHAFLKKLRAHVDAKYGDRMLLAEANQWPEDAAAYFGGGAGDECHASFHFPLMPRLFMAVQNEDRFPIEDILDQTPALPEAGQWVLFLRNHDELTLEMVTDEERDSMYRFFANDPQARINLGIRRRLAPLLGNDRRKIELMTGLLLSLPGTPVLYYGDEIGMGDNIYLGDRNGVRTPMHWSADRNAGFSPANAQKLYLPVIIDPEYHYEAVNVDVQQNNPQSLLWWTKRTVALRRRFARVFGRGRLEMIHPDNRRVLGFLRRWEDQDVLVVANLSRFAQHAELDLSAFKGRVPVEMFGRNSFPAIDDRPYPVTLGPYAFLWFALSRPAAAPARGAPARPTLETAGRWEDLLAPTRSAAVAELLLGYLTSCGTLGHKAEEALEAKVLEAIPFSANTSWVLLQVDYDLPEQPLDVFSVPVAFVTGEAAAEVEKRSPAGVLARLTVGAESGILVDAFADAAFRKALLETLARERRHAGVFREILGHPGQPLRESAADPASPATVEWTSTGVVLIYGEKVVLRFPRRLEAGAHPEVELGRFLSETVKFPRARTFAGLLELRSRRGLSTVLGTAHLFRPAAGSGWRHALDSLGRYFESALTRRPAGGELPAPPASTEPLAALAAQAPPPLAREMIGAFLDEMELLGRITGELELALGSAEEPELAPEPFTMLYQRELYQAMRTTTRQVGLRLRRRMATLPEEARKDAERFLAVEGEGLRRFRAAMDVRYQAQRIRCHGNYYLGKVLYTGRDFVVVGLEGEEFRSLGQRRIKASPLRDVASMIRSFHYAAFGALLGREPGIQIRPQDRAALAPWAEFWKTWVSAAFLRGFLGTGAPAAFAAKPAEFARLLDAFIRERAVREIAYELQQRPAWVAVALAGAPELLETL